MSYEKGYLGVKYKPKTMMDVSYLLGYGFNVKEIMEMLKLSRTTVSKIKLQLKEV